MKIGIDVSAIVYRTGVSAYTKNLVENLLEVDKENEYVLFGGSARRLGEIRQLIDSLGGKVERKLFRLPPTLAEIVWNRLHIVKIEKLVGKVDVFHSSDWTQPPSRAFKVTTVHDLAPLKLGRFTHPRVVGAHRRRLGWVKKEVDRIIVPSEATKNDLVELGFDESKMRVIAEAAEEIFMPAGENEVQKVRRKFRISGNYLLAVGTNPRKNLERIVKAFETSRAEGVADQLVVVGRVEKEYEERGGVRFCGFVDDHELVALYSGATSLAYPSLYEGFGLPILQAMACGCPVVTSNVSSLVEVAKGAAVLVDPYDVESIAKGIKKAVKNKKELIGKGKKRAKEYSWKKTARETLEVYGEGKKQ